ncbi:hypothetical protein CDAR_585131 [Caerostris darwini]|uniref:Uncharacterized protein n=1 Tax=Caerostris darwini TaxID=1538125 RepID=A0AAV4T584_9ARAC|nr:hypothetical protein CDAR_585131 [Caerostris darwini]
MKEVKHSGIALNRNDINNRESVFSGYDKICRDKGSRGIASGTLPAFPNFPAQERCGKLRSHLRKHPADETAYFPKRSGGKQKGIIAPGSI